MELIRGGGMLVDTLSPLVLSVANRDTEEINQVSIEVLPSADYHIESANPVSVTRLLAGSSREVSFALRPRIALEIAVNIRINGELQEPALRIVAIRDNPYVYGNPIGSASAFFGRQKELDDIFQAVTKPNKQDVLLVGERRSGKTSLIYQLQRRLQPPFIGVYILINEAPATPTGVIKAIVRRVIAALIEREVIAAHPWNQYHCKDETLSEILKAIFEDARRKRPEIKVVLLIDEGDYLLKIDDRVQNMLRAALQARDVGADLRAVVAGTTSLSTYVSKESSPFFNHFRFVTLVPLSQAETEDLIAKPAGSLGYVYHPAAIAAIKSASGGHPYYCQRICYEAFALALKGARNLIDDEMSGQAVGEVVSSASDDAFKGFKTYFWDAASVSERALMQQVAGAPEGKVTSSASARLLDWQVIARVDQGSLLSKLTGTGRLEAWILWLLDGREQLAGMTLPAHCCPDYPRASSRCVARSTVGGPSNG